jgi:hypothetical protein
MITDELSNMDVEFKYSQISSNRELKKNLFWSVIHFVSLSIGTLNKVLDFWRYLLPLQQQDISLLSS